MGIFLKLFTTSPLSSSPIHTHSYCLNIMFYLRLKSCNTPVQSHPVIGRIVQIRQVSQPYWLHVTIMWWSCDCQLKRSVKMLTKSSLISSSYRKTIPLMYLYHVMSCDCHVPIMCLSCDFSSCSWLVSWNLLTRNLNLNWKKRLKLSVAKPQSLHQPQARMLRKL